MYKRHPNLQEVDKNAIWSMLSCMRLRDPTGLEIIQSNLEDPEVNKMETVVLLRYHAQLYLAGNQAQSLGYSSFPKLSELRIIEGNREGLGKEIDRYSKLSMMIDKRIIQLQLEASYEISMFYDEYRDVFESFVSQLIADQAST